MTSRAKCCESNELLRILEKYPKLGQSVYNISTNINISFDYIQNHPHPQWDEWERNPNVPLEYIRSKDFKTFAHWRSNLIIRNLNLTLDYIREHHNRGYWIEWRYLSHNPALTIDWLLEFPRVGWDWFVVSANSNITPGQILSNPQFDWDWSGVSRNPSVTMEFIENNPQLPWDSYYIGLNPNIDMIHYKKEWLKVVRSGDFSGVLALNQYGFLSSSMITIESLISELDKSDSTMKWFKTLTGLDYLEAISLNPNLTLDHIKQFELIRPDLYDKIINWSCLSGNRGLKREWIDAYPDKDWDWNCIAANDFRPYYPKRKMSRVMQEEIYQTAIEKRYRLGGPGYYEAKGSFDKVIKCLA